VLIVGLEQPVDHHLAQLNVARALDDLTSPRLADFANALDRVNAVAERSPGFIWRLQSDEAGNAMAIRVTDDPRLIINVSVWETASHLEHFVWNTIHKRVYEKKSKWFSPLSEAHFVMWWVPFGHRPSTDEAMARLAHFNSHGPSNHAFGWQSLPNVKLWMSQRCA
jgi:hypothetical protein